MNDQLDPLFVCRVFASISFFAVLFGGAYLVKNFDKLFGVDPEMPSENSSSRTYTRVQVFTVWAHALVLTGMLALLLH